MTDFTQHLVKAYRPVNHVLIPTVKDFNHGLCFYWAFVFHKLFGGQLVSVLNKEGVGHALVRLNDRFYDASTPDGVKEWRHIKQLKNFPTSAYQELSRKDFIALWNLTETENTLLAVSACIKRRKKVE